MSDPTPQEVLNRWLDAANAGDVEGLLNLYDDAAVLLPTFQGKILDTPDGIRAYFEKLAGYDTLSVAIEEGSLHVQEAAGSVHVLGGNYDWAWSTGGQSTQCRARFTYVVNPAADKPILHHHSSQIPDA